MKQAVKCPRCNSRLLDEEYGVNTLTKVVDPNNPGPPKNRWIPDYYIKCWKCKSKVGLKKSNTAS